MSSTPPPEPSQTNTLSWRGPDALRFQRQVTVVTLGLFFVVLTIYLLREFAPILKPILIAVFILYIVHPIHQALVRRGASSLFAYVLILVLVIGLFVGVGVAVHATFVQLTPARIETYEMRLDRLLKRLLGALGLAVADVPGWSLRDVVSSYSGDMEHAVDAVRAVINVFLGFLTTLLVVSIYLIFMVAEQVTFSERIRRSFGEGRTEQVMSVARSINLAIAQYLAVKTFIGLLGGFLSLLVLWVFGVEFFVVWALLIFLLNYVPYIGSIAASAGPILLSFVQFEELWKGFAVATLLIGIQLVTGQYLEPRMAGKRLNLSPVIIMLALSFWGVLWGIVGMILAVPLTVVAKIILDNIRETRPIATLMSNV